ncbi:hypothetical protein PR001_g7663 [Phytophthora rubi]|uniref:RxLR effector PexRD54 WY domain-containing protein n=1 Tax=Phytophthora rubi TaxID=129364 RepID=A0A6A3N046_9STRA|nr:hypothetical protein PR002_g7963 [Phytophthora rubi]KAE9039095.1 hypothetical protein PR001_g7663 [Phytophthora rubi]
MQRFVLIALLVVALFAVVDAASTTPILKSTAVNSAASFPSLSHDKRLLRIETYEGEGEGDERAIAIPGLTKVKQWLTTNISRFKAWYGDRKQVKAWSKEKKTPEEVFMLLKLDENINKVLNNPKLTTWVRFMRAYNKKNENSVTLIGTLTKFYGNEPLAKMLEVSRRNPATWRLANKLQADQWVGWTGNGLSADVVYKMLKVGDGSVEKLLANLALIVWFHYSNRVNAHKPDRGMAVIKKLTASYDEMELAKAIEVATKDKTTEFISTRLQAGQFTGWLIEGRDPRTVFNRLKLDTKKWPSDPNVDVYRAYSVFYKAYKQ